MYIHSGDAKHNKKARKKSFTVFNFSARSIFQSYPTNLHSTPLSSTSSAPPSHWPVYSVRHFLARARHTYYYYYYCLFKLSEKLPTSPHFRLRPSTVEVKMYRCVPFQNNCVKKYIFLKAETMTVF